MIYGNVNFGKSRKVWVFVRNGFPELVADDYNKGVEELRRLNVDGVEGLEAAFVRYIH